MLRANIAGCFVVALAAIVGPDIKREPAKVVLRLRLCHRSYCYSSNERALSSSTPSNLTGSEQPAHECPEIKRPRAHANSQIPSASDKQCDGSWRADAHPNRHTCGYDLKQVRNLENSGKFPFRRSCQSRSALSPKNRNWPERIQFAQGRHHVFFVGAIRQHSVLRRSHSF